MKETIEQLLEKYFAGDSSLAEEQRLRQYFNSPKVKPSLKAYQPLFQFFEMASETTTDFEPKLPRARVQLFYRWRMAAAILLLIGAWMLLKPIPEPPKIASIDWEVYETTNPDKAFEQTKAALKLVSKHLNSGVKSAVKEVKKTKAMVTSKH